MLNLTVLCDALRLLFFSFYLFVQGNSNELQRGLNPIFLPTDLNDEAFERCTKHFRSTNSDLKSIVEHLTVHQFDFPFWDPIHDNITISRTVDLTGRDNDLVSVALDVCEEYTRGELGEIDEAARLRCLSPTLLTLRLTKVHGMSLLSRQYELYSYDEEIYGLMVGYEGWNCFAGANHELLWKANGKTPDGCCGDENLLEDDDLTACIIGVPTVHSILPPLFTKRISNVIVYSSIFDMEVDDGDSNDTHHCKPISTSINGLSDKRTVWNYFYANEVASMLGKTIEYRSMSELLSVAHDIDSEVERPQCSVIQFNPDHECEPFMMSMTQLEAVMRYLTMTDSDSTVCNMNQDTESCVQVDGNSHSTRVIVIQYSLEALPEVNSTIPYTSVSNQTHIDLLTLPGLERRLTLSASASSLYLRRWDDMWTSFCSNSDAALNEGFTMNTIYSDGDRASRQWDPDYGLTTVTVGSYNTMDSPKHVEDRVIGNMKLIIVLTWSIHIFTENAFALASTIQDLIDNHEFPDDWSIEVYVSAEMSWAVYDYLHTRDPLSEIIHIAVSAVDDVTIFGKHTVIYNSEQISYSSVFSQIGLRRYQTIFQRANAMIWSYDNVTTQYWKDILFGTNDISKQRMLYNRIHSVPYLYDTKRMHVLSKLFDLDYDVTDSSSVMSTKRVLGNSSIYTDLSTRLHNKVPFDMLQVITTDMTTLPLDYPFVLFVGTCTTRRLHFLLYLEYLFAEAYDTGILPVTIKYVFICERVFYYHYDYYLMKAKVILNIASSNVSIFETHRINYLLSLGKVVVSEVGADRSIAERYKEMIIFTQRSEEPSLENTKLHARQMYEVVLELLVRNNSKWNEQLHKVKYGYNQNIIYPVRNLLCAAVQQVYLNIL